MELAQPPELVAGSSAALRRGARAGGSPPRRAGSSRAPRCGSCSATASACRPPTSGSRTGPHGKPELPGASLRFNHSHSGDRALVALAHGVEVGVDVERLARRSQAIERTLTAGERAALDNDDDRHTELLRIWCRKEALAKAIGGGLGWAPETFDTSDPDGHALVDLELDEGYVGALAVAGERTTVTQHRLAFSSSAAGP